MSQSPIEHPSVELSIEHVLVPANVARLTARNAAAPPPEAIKAAIQEYRLFAIRHMKQGLLTTAHVNDLTIRQTLDMAWMTFSPIFKRATGPMIAEAYIRAFQNVQRGDVPISLIYQLADEHAERIGKYFNDTSADAMVQGFNTYVNRKLPQKAAMERVVDAYGMTPRQMSGFTSAAALQPQEVKSGVAQNLKRKIKAYIGASISQRLKIFTGQEEHNLEEQAKQVAWLWLLNEGRITENAEKMWLTAKDERVCETCGPLHGRRIPVKETFTLDSGLTIYTPGAHVNCRCELRLMVPPKLEAVKKADFDESQHRRAADGRFTFKPTTQKERSAPPVKERAPIDPALERLAAEARRMSVEERKEKARKATEELIALGQQIEPEPLKLGLKRQEKLFNKPLNVKGESLGLGSPKERLFSEEQPKEKLGVAGSRERLIDRQPQLKLDITPEQKERMGIELDQLISRVQPIKAKHRRITEEHKDIVNFGKDVFGFVGFHEVDPKSDDDAPLGRVRIPESTELVSHEPDRIRESLLESARDRYTINQYRAVDDLIEENPDPETGDRILERKHPKYGRLYARLSEEDVMTAVDASVHKNSDWAKAKTMSVIWQDRHGNVVFDEDDLEAQMSPKELADRLEVDPQDLEVVIVQTSKGDTGAYQESANTRYGQEIWHAGGVYRITGEATKILGGEHGYPSRNENTIPVRIITVEPDVSPIFHSERTLTDEEADRELGFE